MPHPPTVHLSNEQINIKEFSQLIFFEFVHGSSVTDMRDAFAGSPALEIPLCGGDWIDSKAARNAGDAAVNIADTDSGTPESPATCHCSAGTYLQPRVDSSEAWNKKYEGCYPCPQDEYSLGGDKQTCLKCNQWDLLTTAPRASG